MITGGQLFSSLILVLRFVKGNQSTLRKNMCMNVFLVAPGDGEEFVYSPIGVNITLQCAVNNARLVWIIDNSLLFEVQGSILDSRRIFLNETYTSDGVTISSITIFANREVNNNTRICCQMNVNATVTQH